MRQFVEQGTLEGAQKGGGSPAKGSVPMSPHAVVVVKPCRARPSATPYPSYPACWGTWLNPTLREDAALQVWDCGRQRGPLAGPGEDASLPARGGCWQGGLCPEEKGLQEEGSRPHSTRGGTEETDLHLRSVFFENIRVPGEPQPSSVPTDGGTLALIGLGDGDTLTAEAGEL